MRSKTTKISRSTMESARERISRSLPLGKRAKTESAVPAKDRGLSATCCEELQFFPPVRTAGRKPVAPSKTSPKDKAVPPPKISRTHKPDGVALEDWQRALRRQFGEQQPFILKNTGDHPLFSEFALTNPESGKTYRIAIRGEAPGMNYCSCPDYGINNLGTCKHIEFTLAKLSQQQGVAELLREGYAPPWSEIWLSYGLKREIRFRAGQDAPHRTLRPGG